MAHALVLLLLVWTCFYYLSSRHVHGTSICVDKDPNCLLRQQQNSLINLCTYFTTTNYARVYCARFCGFCHHSPPTLASRSPITTVILCRDTRQDCSLLSASGYCADWRQHAVMKAHCPATCKFCQQSVTSKLPTPIVELKTTRTPFNPFVVQKQNCVDKSSKCSRWKFYCRAQSYKAFMAANCRMTCNLCSSATQTPTTRKFAKVSSTVSFLNNCTDYGPGFNCPFYKMHGYCENHKYLNWMAINCPVLCGICNKLPTIKKVHVIKNCTDSSTIECSKLANTYGFCYNAVDFMVKYCPTTCHFCEPITVCEDRFVNKATCKNLLAYCLNERFHVYMRKNCPLSCNFCTASQSTMSPSSLSASHSLTTMSFTSRREHLTKASTMKTFATETQTVPGLLCVDKSRVTCQRYSQNGFCQHRSFELTMKRDCPRTCGFCRITHTSSIDPNVVTLFTTHFQSKSVGTSGKIRTSTVPTMIFSSSFGSSLELTSAVHGHTLISSPLMKRTVLPLCEPDCEDKLTSLYCSLVISKCSDPNLREVMQRDCAVTCQFCTPYELCST